MSFSVPDASCMKRTVFPCFTLICNGSILQVRDGDSQDIHLKHHGAGTHKQPARCHIKFAGAPDSRLACCSTGSR